MMFLPSNSVADEEGGASSHLQDVDAVMPVGRSCSTASKGDWVDTAFLVGKSLSEVDHGGSRPLPFT